MKIYPLLLSMIFLTGCMSVRKPCVTMPSIYQQEQECDVCTNETPSLDYWWEKFEDPMLNQLVEKALTCNYDLNIAREKIVEARSIMGIERSKLLPHIDGELLYSRVRNSETMTESPFLGGRFLNLFQSGFDAIWEFDLFGKNLDYTRASIYDICATAENMRNVHLTVASEVVRVYLRMRTLQSQIEVTENHIKSEENLHNLIKERYEAGLTPELNVYTSKALLETRKAVLPSFQAEFQESVYTLAVLTGDLPENLGHTFDTKKPIPHITPNIEAGIPSELLCRRPDIRDKEFLLRAAGVRLRASKKELFPTISIGALYSWASGFASKWFKPDSRSGNLTPLISLPLFHGGAIWSNIHVENSRQRQAVLAYEQTILTALKEVESSLISYIKQQIRHEALIREVEANQKARDLAQVLYIGGFVDFLYVLDVERDLFLSKNLLIRSQENLMVYLVAFYKSLGGGLECSALP